MAVPTWKSTRQSLSTSVPLKHVHTKAIMMVSFFFGKLAKHRSRRDHGSTRMDRHIQSSHPSRQSVNSVREISRAPTTSVDTTSRITLQAIRFGARFSGSMKLDCTPGGGGPAGNMGIGSICPSMLKSRWENYTRGRMDCFLAKESEKKVGRSLTCGVKDKRQASHCRNFACLPAQPGRSWRKRSTEACMMDGKPGVEIRLEWIFCPNGAASWKVALICMQGGRWEVLVPG